MKRITQLVPLAIMLSTLLLTARTSAVGTRRFILQNAEDYKSGDLKGVALDSLGRLRAGWNLGALPVAQASVIWSALDRKDGSVLLGTGNEGKLLELRGAKLNVLAETGALVVTSVVQAWGGAIVLGTVPDGKVMKYERGKLSTLATLKGAEHVWQLAFDAKSQSIFAATGPEGKLWRVTAGGDAQVYFDAEEQHLMSIAVASDGTIYAGASDKAKLYKITGPGRASVLYDFARTEVRAIAISPKGEVYAIANEIKSGSYAPRRGRSGQGGAAQPTQPPPKTQGKGTLFVFSRDGAPEQLLDDAEEHYVSLALGDEGRPYVGTGVHGRVYTVDARHNSLLISDSEERQISALILNGKQQLVVASDPAVVHPLRGMGGTDAIWTSRVLDAGIRARFGRLSWDSTGALELSTRTGNTKEPDDTWSAWSRPLVAPGPVESPAARYIQVRARWSRDRNAVLNELTLPFVTDNLRAVVTEIDASSGAKKSRRDSSDSSPEGVTESGGPVDRKADANVNLTWKVDNPDKDSLRFRLQYRLANTQTWFDILKPHEKLTKESHSWDTSDLPEGTYRVRVIASDELANPPDRVKRDDMESGIVLVDNTAPNVEALRLQGRRLQATLADGVGPIQRIEVSVVGTDEWFPLYPADGVFDEAREELDADVSGISPAGSVLLSVRVYDKAGNFVVRSIAAK